MYKIEWNKKAIKQLKRIPTKYQKAILTAVAGLKDLTTCRNVKTIKDEDYEYRLRVGRYRVLFDYAEVIKIIYIQEVKKRDDRTY